MRRFLLVSIAMLTVATPKASGCSGEERHNYYMFNTMPKGAMAYGDDDLLPYWESYTGVKWTDEVGAQTETWSAWDYYFGDDMKRLRECAQRKGDAEMGSYLHRLGKQQRALAISTESWDYPTKEQLAEQSAIYDQLLGVCKAYKGSRLAEQYALMQMRIQMAKGLYADNISLWQQKASRFADGPLKKRMRNIYANALYKTGKSDEAIEIYSEQGDWESLCTVLRGCANYQSISRILNEKPNSPAHLFLLQQFVNSAQETIDCQYDRDDVEYTQMKYIDAEQVRQLTLLADDVVAKRRADDLCLWKSAAAALRYLSGEQDQAESDIDEAIALSGSDRSKDNARCIRLLIKTRRPLTSKALTDYAAQELRWLSTTTNGRDYHYRMLDRTVYQNIIPAYIQSGRGEMAAAVQLWMQQTRAEKWGYEADDDEANPLYYGDNPLTTMGADYAVRYGKLLSGQPANAMEQLVKEQTKAMPAGYMDDLIGTRMMAEGRYAEAEPYLERVPIALLNRQAIAVYAANRRYDIDPWMMHQTVFPYRETTNRTVKANQKLDFCREMRTLLGQLRLQAGDARAETAYTAASRMAQASCYGDCWYLTHYGQSVADSAVAGEKDLCATAIGLLNEARASSSVELQRKALFGIAFLTMQREQSYYRWSADWDAPEYAWMMNSAAARQAYSELSRFNRSNPTRQRYVSTCNVLRLYEKRR